MTIEDYIRNTVIEMWNKGKTALQISLALRHEGYLLSRSAISGRVKRLQDIKVLQRRTSPITNRPTRIRTPKKIPSPPPPPVVEVKYNNPVSLVDLKNDQCRYPLENKMFCGDPVHKFSYCVCHYQLCYMSLLKYRGIASVTVNPTNSPSHPQRKSFGPFRY
jgi:hypothetical protein